MLPTIIVLIVLTCLTILITNLPSGNSQPASIESNLQTAHPPPQVPVYIRPTMDPYGRPWPKVAAYIHNSKKSHTRGYSKVTVDNQENDSDVYVKLIALSAKGDKCVREFFIPARSHFTVSRVSPDLYEIRSLLLNSGSSSRTESFHLEETRTKDGTNYSILKLTLYNVANGNMHSYPISPDEFYNIPVEEDEVPNL